MNSNSKIERDEAAFLQRIAKWRKEGLSIVLTNGAFDLLHVGHLRALEDARAQGDRLVVGVNSDSSVQASKGPNRPIVPEDERIELVAGLGCVDLVTCFAEVDARALIERVRPDVHAKGRDYTAESVPERDLVQSLGGRIAIVGDPKDHATTDVIATIKARA